MQIPRKAVVHLFAALLMVAGSAIAQNSYITNPFALQYNESDYSTLIADYYGPTAVIVSDGCNVGAPGIQNARAHGAEVLEYIDPVELPSWTCDQAKSFYTGASNEQWSPLRYNYSNEPMLDISVGSAWSQQVVDYVTGRMTSGQIDGVFIDVLGARLWSQNGQLWTDMQADVLPTGVTEADTWTLGAVDLVRRLDRARRQNNRKFIIVNNNNWVRGDALGLVGEWYVDGISIENHLASETVTPTYAAHDYTSLGHRRVLAIAKTNSDADAWARIQGVTHVANESNYQTVNPPEVAPHPLSDLAYTAQFFGTFDYTTGSAPSGYSASSGLGTNYKRGSKYTLGEAATLLELSAYMDGNGGGGGTQKVRMEIYSDSSGAPGALLGSSGERTIPARMAGSWVHFTMPPVSLSAGSYWLVIHTGDTNGVARDYGSTTAGNWYGNADTYSDGGTNPFGSGTVGTGPLAAHATYIPSSKQFGRTTIATVPSAGLGTNFKRGSKFTLGQSGTLLGLNAYLDGNGGTTGSQQLRMALYQDSSGTPGAKVLESNVATVTSGQAPGWVAFTTSAVPLAAGTYWIVIQSGDTGGVARDYGDGAADWFGGSDTFSDGASNPFGTGSTGTVTLSVFASYY